MKYAAIGPIAMYLPPHVDTNDMLGSEFPHWDMDLIYSKVGVRARHIAAPDQCASDLGVAAAERLFADYQVDRDSIDFLLFCTQTPDYPLPSTSCLVQRRLGLPTSIGALDFNLGCSGFVYGLSLADGLIRSGAARRILFITADTYSRYIAPDDRSLRTVFGDGAAATLIEAADTPSLGSFVFGTDGSGAEMLMVNRGGTRPSHAALQPSGRQRWDSALYMDGPGLIAMTLEKVPALIDQVLAHEQLDREQVDLFLMHQATYVMIEHIRKHAGLETDRVPLGMEDYGNTVSSTVPIMMHDLRAGGRLRPGTRSMLIGYGVGYSWAGCLWTETWSARGVAGRHAA